jgi:hypothetical protein
MIFNEEDASDLRTRGEENVRKAVGVILNATLSIDTRDVFGVNGEFWQVLTVQRGTDPVIVVEMKFIEPEIRNGGGGSLL